MKPGALFGKLCKNYCCKFILIEIIVIGGKQCVLFPEAFGRVKDFCEVCFVFLIVRKVLLFFAYLRVDGVEDRAFGLVIYFSGADSFDNTVAEIFVGHTLSDELCDICGTHIGILLLDLIFESSSRLVFERSGYIRFDCNITCLVADGSLIFF